MEKYNVKTASALIYKKTGVRLEVDGRLLVFI